MQELEHRLDRRLEAAERNRIGVTQLRRFLEQLLQRRYASSQVLPLSWRTDRLIPITMLPLA